MTRIKTNNGVLVAALLAFLLLMASDLKVLVLQ